MSLRPELKDLPTRLALAISRDLAPPWRREWAEALAAETWQLEGAAKRLGWAAGGVPMSIRWGLIDLPRDWAYLLVALSGALAISAYRLEDTNQAPDAVLLLVAALGLTCVRPHLGWLWFGLLVGMLPLLVTLTRMYGPYYSDRFDMFYAALPVTAGVLAGRGLVALRRRRAA